MTKTLVSYGGFAFDGVNINAYLPDDSGIKQQPVKAVYVPRHLMPPIYGVVTANELIFSVMIEFLTSDPDYIDTVKAAFDTMYNGEQKLLAVDHNSKQWYRMAKVVDQQPFKNTHLLFKLSAGEAAWRSETVNSDTSWTVTASGQQHVITPTVGGNVAAYPIIRLTPTGAKSGNAFNYRRLSRVYSQSDNGATTYPVDITHGGWDTAAVIADSSKSNQINQLAGITAGDTTIPIDTAVGGGLPSTGMGYVGTEQISWTANSGSSLTGVTRGLNGTTAATHADNAVIKWSRMQADGGDVRIFVDRAEIDYWFGTGANAINQAATKVWVNLNLAPRLELTLSGNMGTGGITAIDVRVSGSGKKIMVQLPVSGRLQIGNEVFSYSTYDVSAGQFLNVTRAINDTTAAAHNNGDAIRWLQHEVYLMYGNQALDNPTISDALKPMIDLTSTNASWVYTSFADQTGIRPGSWVGAVLATNAKVNEVESAIYTGNHAADADPATEMGMKIGAWQHGAKWRDEKAQVEWRLSHPFGITTVTSDGEKYRSSASWASGAALQYSPNGRTRWFDVWSESTGTLVTWDSWTHNAASLGGTRRDIRFYLFGVQKKGTGDYFAFEVNGATLTIAEPPTGALDAEVSNYEINCQITHVETGQFFTLRRNVALNEYVEVNSDVATVIYHKDVSHGPRPGLDQNRPHYLELLAGAANTLQFDDSGTASLDVDIYWQDRAN